MNVADALRELAAALDHEAPEPAASEPMARYYTARTAPIEKRAWDRAVKEIRTFRPGRELMVLADDLHAWIEEHFIVREIRPNEVSSTDPVDFAAFKRSALRRSR